MLFQYIPWELTEGGKLFTVNFFFISFILTSLLYLKVQYVVGTLCVIFYGTIAIVLRMIFLEANKNPESFQRVWNIALAIHASAWIAQFIGHGFFEHRKPALCDNFLLTLNAPFFVVAELLMF